MGTGVNEEINQQLVLKRVPEEIRDGRLKIPSWEVEGDINAFPRAFRQLYEGSNLGKMLVKLPAAG